MNTVIKHSKPSRRKWRKLWWIFVLIAAAALAAAVVFFAWSKGAFLPKWIVWEEKTLNLKHTQNAAAGNTDHARGSGDGSADISDGSRSAEPEAIVLKNRRLEVQKDGAAAWESPGDILVQDFLWCDINHDRKNELLLLCWRIGRYGNARPFWVEKDEKKWSQHIYIYEWRDGEIHPLWMASDIGMDAAAFDFDETKRLHITEVSGRETYWDWLSWGLTMIGEE